MKKTLITILCTVLVCSCVMGVTLAFLMDKTTTITNTFTVGNVDIDLAEGDNLDLKIVPGKQIKKDPIVTVKANSEKCYLFVEVVKGGSFDACMSFSIAEGWTQLEVNGNTAIYYRTVDASTVKQEFHVLANDQVSVGTDVTKATLSGDTFSTPTLAFTAYAVQFDNVDDVATAWVYAQQATIN